MAESSVHEPTNPVVFFDIALAGEFLDISEHGYIHQRNTLNVTGEALGRVKMELFAKITPRTAENFRQFCTGESKNPKGQPQGYKGSKFHRVVGDMHQPHDHDHGLTSYRSKTS